MQNSFTIAISGATGFIGSYLTTYFTQLGYRVLPISRQALFIDESMKLKSILAQSQIVINLAGAPINRFWTNTYKKKLSNSRIVSTRKIVGIINQLVEKPQLLISASAIGFYPSKGCYSEANSTKGEGFLPNLCQAWEDEAKGVDASVRLVVTRLGVVLSHEGGAFRQMSFSTKFKVATVVGDSERLLSWISIVDLTSAMEHIINESTINGAVNLVSPCSITNKEMLNDLARHYNSLIKLRISALVARFIFGESANFIIESPCAQPQKLIDSGFSYQILTFQEFLVKQ